MRLKVIFLFVLLGFLPVLSLAKSEKGKNFGTFSWCLANDIFAITDRRFTSGFQIGWMSKDLKNYRENPWLKWMPFVNKPEFQHAISISLGHSIYTPDQIWRSYLIEEDCPYAGIFYFSFGIHSIGNLRMATLEVSIGILGPHSYAEQIQKFIHSLYNGIRPNGWGHQLKDELALGVIYERRWKLPQLQFNDGSRLEFIPHMGLGLGNVQTYASTGMQIRFGRNLPKDFGAPLIRPGGDCNMTFRRSGGSGVYAFFAVDGKAVLRNIFLDGNTFRNSHRVDKKYFTSDILLGVSMRFGRVNISYAYVLWTKRFKTEPKEHIFGVLNLSYSY